ncbi:MAG: CotH kinase family protein [Alistipes sp.]|nr:CotH kinase family protein [Alistipes sp.]
MKTYQYFLLVATLFGALTIWSCGEDDTIIPDNPQEEPQPEPEPDPEPEPEPEPPVVIEKPVVPDEPEPEPEPDPENEGQLLSGEIIGTRYSVDYDNGNQQSETVNTKANVFDGDYNTYFASYERSGTWVGLDLGEKHVITKIGYSPRISQPTRVELAILEGANSPDFIDAVPLHIIKSSAPENQMTYATVECSRGFRYVRYVSPNDVRCNLAELQFYGVKGEGDDSKLYQLTNLPTVVINTAGAQDITSKEYEITSTVHIISDNGKTILTDTETGVRGRGNASWNFPKKPYRLKFSSKRSPLGAPAKAKKWTLINNYGDKTLMRNILAFEVSRRAGLAYTPFCHPVDVILNGEYKGCYQLCDQIEVAKGRVDITEMEPEDVSGDNLTGGYLIEIDAYANGEASYFYSKEGTPVTIKSPDDEDIVASQSAYIKNFFDSMESAVFASNFTDEQKGYRKYLDLDSFLQFFIVGEFAGNTDTYWSVYMYKDRNSGKLYTGPIWDYDLAFENDNRTYPINNIGDFIYATKGSVASESVRNMVNRIIKEDTAARERLIEIWDGMRSSNLTEESLLEYVSQTAALLEESQQLNFKRWKILNEQVHQNYQALGSYSAEVYVIKNYIRQRLTTMDSLIRNK